ncbi:unnamed protein product [Rotaria sp. Silwood1]|nr:unnamed protein product [Rotaria sp. Silwood1]
MYLIVSAQCKMAATEDTCLDLTTFINTDSSSAIQQNDSLNTASLPSTTAIIMDSDTADDKEINPKTFNRYKSVGNISLSVLSRRLTKRKKLHQRLSVVADIMFILSVLGIILMIIENELTFSQINNHETIASWSIKIVISLSTVILLGFVIEYHRLDISLYAVNNSIEDVRVAITYERIITVVLEILICAVHPMPRSFPRHSNASSEDISSNDSTVTPHPLSYASVDVGLGLPMFLRLYLLWRVVMFHSHLFRDASSRSVGYLNRVSIDYFFLIKTYLEQWPVVYLTTFCIIVFLIGSWSLRACSYSSTNEHLTMQNTMWLFVITFTTVGYGDFTPSTYCGRTIAAIIALVGVLSTALLISVLAQKLVMNRWEKYVNNFVLDIELAKKRKTAAANVIKYAFKVWGMKKRNIPKSSIRYFQAQRRLFQSIHSLHQVKQQQGQLVDNCVDQIDIIALQRQTGTQTSEITEELKMMKLNILRMEKRLVTMNININNTINDMQNTLNVLLEKRSK